MGQRRLVGRLGRDRGIEYATLGGNSALVPLMGTAATMSSHSIPLTRRDWAPGLHCKVAADRLFSITLSREYERAAVMNQQEGAGGKFNGPATWPRGDN